MLVILNYVSFHIEIQDFLNKILKIPSTSLSPPFELHPLNTSSCFEIEWKTKQIIN